MKTFSSFSDAILMVVTVLMLAAFPCVGISQNTSPFPSTGNVGIGTTSPTYPLHVESAPNDGVYVQGYFKSNSSSAPYGGIGVDGVNQSHIRFMLGGTLKWQWRGGAGNGGDALRGYSWALGADGLSLNKHGN